MIKENIPLNKQGMGKKMNIPAEKGPFLLRPACKDYLWGGERLEREYGKNYGVTPLAETWECSTHSDGVSVIESGAWKGMDLDVVLKRHPEILGEHPAKISKPGTLPILVKLIDAGENASVQVHPDDEYAQKYESGEMGKTEMWYILDAQEEARLVYGFYRDMDAETVRNAIRNQTLDKYLQKVKVCKDDVFFIEPGQIHAIGKGVVLAEIQQNSNVTYRLYDYNRRDKNGGLRELHPEKALDVAKLHKSTEPRQPMRVLKYQPGCATELLCRCRYFQVERVLINTTPESGEYIYQVSKESFQVLLCLEGEGTMECKETLFIHKGECFFVPANCGTLKLKGKMQLLKIRC